MVLIYIVLIVKKPHEKVQNQQCSGASLKHSDFPALSVSPKPIGSYWRETYIYKNTSQV